MGKLYGNMKNWSENITFTGDKGEEMLVNGARLLSLLSAWLGPGPPVLSQGFLICSESGSTPREKYERCSEQAHDEMMRWQ